MPDSTTQLPSPMPWYDTSVVIGLPGLFVVAIDETAPQLLRVEPDALPTSISPSLIASDWDLLRSSILEELTSGRPWSGVLRFIDSAERERTRPVMIVPHVVDEQPPEFATLLLASGSRVDSWAGAIDHLTGLPTRPVLLDRLDNALMRNLRSDRWLGVLFLDLDGLKVINDRYGHETGDDLLREAAIRINACLRVGDTLARFGGDEFVVLCEELDTSEQGQAVANRILDSLLRTEGEQVIAVSVGLAFCHDGQLSATELVGRADTAMYRAKRRGGRRVEVFDREMQDLQDAEADMRLRIADAIQNDGLSVAAQAIFELSTGVIRGVELFVRLDRDGGDIVTASDLLRLAREYTGAVDRAVLSRAMELANKWRRVHGLRAPRVHVNLSPQTLADSGFASRLSGELRRQHLPTGSLVLEIDEMTLAQADGTQRATLAALNAADFLLAVDGFAGTGDALRAIGDRAHLIKLDALSHQSDAPAPNLGAVVRPLVPMGFSTCIKGLESHDAVLAAVGSGAFAGQGDALHPTQPLDGIRALLSRPVDIGF